MGRLLIRIKQRIDDETIEFFDRFVVSIP